MVHPTSFNRCLDWLCGFSEPETLTPPSPHHTVERTQEVELLAEIALVDLALAEAVRRSDAISALIIARGAAPLEPLQGLTEAPSAPKDDRIGPSASG